MMRNGRGGHGGYRASRFLSMPFQKFGPNIAEHRKGSDLLGAKGNSQILLFSFRLRTVGADTPTISATSFTGTVGK